MGVVASRGALRGRMFSPLLDPQAPAQRSASVGSFAACQRGLTVNDGS